MILKLLPEVAKNSGIAKAVPEVRMWVEKTQICGITVRGQFSLGWPWKYFSGKTMAENLRFVLKYRGNHYIMDMARKRGDI